jgi:hypothetical protein
MRSKLALEIGLVLLVLGAVIQCQEVRAIRPTLDSGDIIDRHAGDFGSSSNIQPVEDYLLNLTLHGYVGFKHKFVIDYSGGPPESGSGIPSDATGVSNAVTPAIPEFPSVLVLPIFMVVTLLGIMICKMKRIFNA